MRVSYFQRSNNFGEGDMRPRSLQLTGPLILHADPVSAQHALTKRYVDSLFSTNLDATKITSGLINKNRIPRYSGDLSNPTDPATFKLREMGIVPGTYTKVTLNHKGIVVGTSALVEADIPELNWNKMAPDTPNTLQGYGITDGINIQGDTLTTPLGYTGPKNNSMNPVTRGSLVQALVNSSSPDLAVGCIVERPVSIEIPGFVRCDGRAILVDENQSLFTVIGTYYNKAGDNNAAMFRVPDLRTEETGNCFFFIKS